MSVTFLHESSRDPVVGAGRAEMDRVLFGRVRMGAAA
jgi:hypothetical protein